MRNWVLTVVGLVLTVAGVIWALQGFGEIGGSFMSGNSVWAVIGPLVAAAGLALVALGLLRARAGRARLRAVASTAKARPCAAGRAARPTRRLPAARR
jgi:hypothetical protein